MNNKILNKEVINEIQSYLSSMNWALTEYKGELLNTYLRGVEDALFEKGLTMVIKRQSSGYRPVHYVELRQYEDFTDCYSNKKILGRIYEDGVQEF